MSDTPHVGFIGLGVMGGRIAMILARSGYTLDVFDVDLPKTRAVAEVGLAVPASTRAAAERSDVVFTSLPWPATVRDVDPILGAGGVVEGARPGAILVDTSTVDPERPRARSMPPPRLAGSTISTSPEGGPSVWFLDAAASWLWPL